MTSVTALPTTMPAAYIMDFGAPTGIIYGQLAVPTAGSAEVLVEVAHTTVNPVDTFVRSGRYPTPVTFPLAVGRDAIGRVALAGPDSGFEVGEQVWCNSLGHAGRPGAAARYTVVAADRLYRTPSGVDAAEFIAAVHPAATAYLALFTHGRVRAGETVLVAGGAGNVGAALVELAAHTGARVIATASECDLDYCRKLGAVEAIAYPDPHLAERVRQASPHGVDVHLDTSGTNDLALAVDLLAPSGRIVVLAGARSRPALPAGQLYMKDGSIIGFVISRASVDDLAAAAQEINRIAGGGGLRPRRLERRPLWQAGQVHQMLEAGRLHGRRIVLDIGGDIAGALPGQDPAVCE